MFFTLEVLQAKHGDCLILHYGTDSDRKVLLIDGGPSGVYTNYLKPRLLEIKAAISEHEPLNLEMVMISHADDDHINGIKMLTNELVSMKDDYVQKEEWPFNIKKLWFNAFDDIIGNKEIPIVANLSGDASVAGIEFTQIPVFADVDPHIAAVIVSTGQGRTIRDNADKLGLVLNAGFSKIAGNHSGLVRGDNGIDAFSEFGLDIKVVHPNQQRLEELQTKWDADLKKAKDDGDDSIIVAAITHPDKSPFNLSSIVCIAEFGGKRILLTGDARCDDIFEGLQENGLLDGNGKAHFDILKMPHHGSYANMSPEFLQAVTADHYVFSADGKHDNPDQLTLDMIAENVNSGILHFTNHDGESDLRTKMDDFAAHIVQDGKDLYVSYPNDGKNSSFINLFDVMGY